MEGQYSVSKDDQRISYFLSEDILKVNLLGLAG